MYPSDDDLREALRSETPPAGFAERVLEDARQRGTKRRSSGRSRWMAAAAIIALLTAVGSLINREQVRQTEGERAKDALLLGLRLTGEKLRTAQAQVQQIETKRIEIDN